MPTLADIESKLSDLQNDLDAETTADGKLILMYQQTVTQMAQVSAQLAAALASMDPAALQTAADMVDALKAKAEGNVASITAALATSTTTTTQPAAAAQTTAGTAGTTTAADPAAPAAAVTPAATTITQPAAAPLANDRRRRQGRRPRRIPQHRRLRESSSPKPPRRL